MAVFVSLFQQKTREMRGSETGQSASPADAELRMKDQA